MFIITSCITGFSGLQYAIFADGKVQPWNTYWKKTEGSDGTTKEITNHTVWMVAIVETPPLSVCLSVSMSCQSCKWVTHENTCWPLMCYIDVLSWIGPWYLNWAQIVQLGFQQFSYKNPSICFGSINPLISMKKLWIVRTPLERSSQTYIQPAFHAFIRKHKVGITREHALIHLISPKHLSVLALFSKDYFHSVCHDDPRKD